MKKRPLLHLIMLAIKDVSKCLIVKLGSVHLTIHNSFYNSQQTGSTSFSHAQACNSLTYRKNNQQNIQFYLGYTVSFFLSHIFPKMNEDYVLV